MNDYKSWLAIGAHADDVEIGMAGSIALHTAKGGHVTICDLTEAELSSNGTVTLRKEEARQAAKVLGVERRFTIGLPDRGLYMNQEAIMQIVSLIREVKPDCLFIPYWEDRHPDHGNAAKLVEEAAFSAGVKNVLDPKGHAPHRVGHIYYYYINGFHKPSFCVDVSAVYDRKIEALQCYRSQFTKGEHSFDTPLVNGYIEGVSAREKIFGQEVGVTFAEGFYTKKPLLVQEM
ncbi:hypothetical protein A374_03544 [Fictibacillus macauensis ZFHKF-1]|uniref:Bacillithiol biosynthesis deacetylase BshB1 n=1 Tax=Fictibacillus macauensis ZFHKF-1 TaxID=1196324 RepID=I8UIG4_9BACL|nr:bacillithiol biosynthesis deacetylase BshB1 [Fictibacillus macauensis]EIT86613.1 hypothetical protein A374_03544 [Fictibacillus macauensis ZFHKF-1]